MRKFFRRMRLGACAVFGFALGYTCTVGVGAITGLTGLPLFLAGQVVCQGYSLVVFG